MNVYGVAREVSVLYDVPLRPARAGDRRKRGPPASEAWQVEVEAPDLCPRFCGRVLDVRIGPSPAWLRDAPGGGRRAAHQQPGRPHQLRDDGDGPSLPRVRPRARSPGGRMTVRWAREGERLTTLDGQERALREGVGVVAGPEGPLALAGIMGGASSEVSRARRARWPWRPRIGSRWPSAGRPRRWACTPRPPTASSAARIPRGRRWPWPASPTCWRRSARATARPGLIDRYVAPRSRAAGHAAGRRAPRPSWGCKVPESDAAAHPEGPGLRRCGRWPARAIAVEVPTWRGDVSREADLIEEVGRHFGLDEIPSTLPPARGVEGLRPGAGRGAHACATSWPGPA